MMCHDCRKVLSMWSFTFVFTGPTPPDSAPVTLCVECLREMIGEANMRRLRRSWADAPYIQVELPL